MAARLRVAVAVGLAVAARCRRVLAGVPVPVRLPVPVANPARKRDDPPMRNLSEIPKLNFENRFLPGNFGPKTIWPFGKTANWISENRFNRENHGGKQFGLVTVGALWPNTHLP